MLDEVEVSVNKELSVQQKDFSERSAKQFAALKEAGEDLEALLVIRQSLENSITIDPLLENKGKAIVKSIVVVLAAIYEEHREGIPLLLDTMAISSMIEEKVPARFLTERAHPFSSYYGTL